MEDFEEGALNEGADASPADGEEIIDDIDQTGQLATDQDDPEEALNDGEDGEDDPKGPVPYSRFAEVNGKYQDLNRWSPILAALAGQGFDSPEAVQAALDQQAQQREADRITATYQVQVDQGLLDPDIANQRLQTDLDRRAVERERQQLAGWALGRDVEAAVKQFPEADTDYVRAMAQATGRPVVEIAKKSHDERAAYRERVIAEYTTKKESAKPAPEGKGGKPPSKPSGVPAADSPDFDKWYEQELRKTLQTYR